MSERERENDRVRKGREGKGGEGNGERMGRT